MKTDKIANLILYTLSLTLLLYAVNIVRLSNEYGERQLKALHTPTTRVIIEEKACEEPEIIEDWIDWKAE